MSMNTEQHERFLALLQKWEDARRKVESIVREHISSGPTINRLPPVTPTNHPDRSRRLKKAESEEQQYRNEIQGILAKLVDLGETQG